MEVREKQEIDSDQEEDFWNPHVKHTYNVSMAEAIHCPRNG